jgi:cytochrome P450
MHLARLELTIALETLVREVPSLELAVGRDELRGTDGPTIRGWQAVPVRIPAG